MSWLQEPAGERLESPRQRRETRLIPISAKLLERGVSLRPRTFGQREHSWTNARQCRRRRVVPADCQRLGGAAPRLHHRDHADSVHDSVEEQSQIAHVAECVLELDQMRGRFFRQRKLVERLEYVAKALCRDPTTVDRTHLAWRIDPADLPLESPEVALYQFGHRIGHGHLAHGSIFRRHRRCVAGDLAFQ